MVKENFKSFKARLIRKMSHDDVMRVMFAYQLAKEAHRRQKRDDGKTRYFEHARKGCLVLMDELGIYNARLLVAFLLHDTGEDTPLLGNILENYEEWIIDANFRANLLYPGTADLVIGMTKPPVDGVYFETKEQVQSYYVNQLKSDHDLLLLKTVDRLINIREMASCTIEKIKKQITETRTIYLPVFCLLYDSIHISHTEYLITELHKTLEQLDSRVLV